MGEIKNGSLKSYWQIIDIVEKPAVAIVLGYVTWTPSTAQHNLKTKAHPYNTWRESLK